MTEQEFLEQWQEDKASYQAWGEFVSSSICDSLKITVPDFKNFLKLPCETRIKDDISLIDKAFYREDKRYNDPYAEIHDKVGCRFVVLLERDIYYITDAIEHNQSWKAVQCRNFGLEREKAPLLFTYQSVHYVIRPKEDSSINGTAVSADTPCEVQIRTLLQHAYAELTHDAIYKAKTIINPSIQRTVARSMALIETTDEFFSKVNSDLNSTPFEQLQFQSFLDELYLNFTGQPCTVAQKSSITILDQFSELLSDETRERITVFFKGKNDIRSLINHKRERLPWYSQSIVLFIIWLISRYKLKAITNWPIEQNVLSSIATDIGHSLDIV